MTKEERYISTTDDFYPNYSNNKVEAKVFKIEGSPNKFHDMSKISVWGADDFGMEIEGSPDDYEKFLEIYNNLPEPITIQWLKDNGFTYG